MRHRVDDRVDKNFQRVNRVSFGVSRIARKLCAVHQVCIKTDQDDKLAAGVVNAPKLWPISVLLRSRAIWLANTLPRIRNLEDILNVVKRMEQRMIKPDFLNRPGRENLAQLAFKIPPFQAAPEV